MGNIEFVINPVDEKKYSRIKKKYYQANMVRSLIVDKLISIESRFFFLVSNEELNDFFNRTNDQITRITSNQVSNSIANNSPLAKRFVMISD